MEITYFIPSTYALELFLLIESTTCIYISVCSLLRVLNVKSNAILDCFSVEVECCITQDTFILPHLHDFRTFT
jgi:hypothetical protein